MSSAENGTATNLKPEDLMMDTRGGKDPRYYCLPPFRGDRARPGRGGGFPLHLVFQGRKVGIFNRWTEAKDSVSGYPGGGNQGFHTEEDCIEAWQGMCVLGIHPHPVDPAFVNPPTPHASAFVNVSPRKSTPKSTTRPSPAKAERAPGDEKVLADLKRYCSPILPPPASSTPRKGARSAATADGPYVNFAIRGGGVISSSAERSAQRYRDLQRQGEEPDMLVTRSLEQATLFALDEDDAEGERHGN